MTEYPGRHVQCIVEGEKHLRGDISEKTPLAVRTYLHIYLRFGLTDCLSPLLYAAATHPHLLPPKLGVGISKSQSDDIEGPDDTINQGPCRLNCLGMSALKLRETWQWRAAIADEDPAGIGNSKLEQSKLSATLQWPTRHSWRALAQRIELLLFNALPASSSHTYSL